MSKKLIIIHSILILIIVLYILFFFSSRLKALNCESASYEDLESVWANYKLTCHSAMLVLGIILGFVFYREYKNTLAKEGKFDKNEWVYFGKIFLMVLIFWICVSGLFYFIGKKNNWMGLGLLNCESFDWQIFTAYSILGVLGVASPIISHPVDLFIVLGLVCFLVYYSLKKLYLSGKIIF